MSVLCVDKESFISDTLCAGSRTVTWNKEMNANQYLVIVTDRGCDVAVASTGAATISIACDCVFNGGEFSCIATARRNYSVTNGRFTAPA